MKQSSLYGKFEFVELQKKIGKKGKMIMVSKNEGKYLMLKRFCGEEKYPVECTEWYILEGDGTWDDPYTFCLEMAFATGEELHEDTKELEAEPSWEISFPALKLRKKDLQTGFIMDFANEDEDEEANFYYCEHQPTIDNKVEVLEVKGNSLLLRVTAKTMDVNFYDGSKPMNELEVIAWFSKQDQNFDHTYNFQ